MSAAQLADLKGLRQQVDSLLNIKRDFSFEGGGNFSL
jgi:hypothetical protein